MRIQISKSPPSSNNYVHVSDLQLLDIIVENSEATEIIVDDFLGEFAFKDLGDAIQKIVSKLRKNGKIIFYHPEADMICYQRSRSMIDVETLNAALFGSGERRSLLPVENLIDLLVSFGLKIESQQLHSSCQAIIIATR